MSELERLMSILRKVYDRPQSREEFRYELYMLHEKDSALYEQTLVELEKLAPQLHREAVDFIFNINDVKDFLRKLEEYKASPK